MDATSTTNVGQRGALYRDGKLFLFGPRRRLVVSGWPQLDVLARAESPRRRRKWWRPVQMLNLAAMTSLVRRAERDRRVSRATAQRAEAYRQFLASVPAEAQALVRRYHDRHLELLQFLARTGTPGFELMADIPALAYMLANVSEFSPGREAQHDIQVWLCSIRRREALARFGFPAEERVVRIVRKIPSAAVSTGNVKRLREFSAECALPQVLSHVKYVNTAVILSVSNEILAERMASSLVLELGRKKGDLGLSPELDMVIEVTYREWMGPFGGDLELPFRLKSMKQVRREHQRIIDSIAAGQVDEGLLALEFPPPPFDVTGADWLEPLDTAAKVADEAREMRHCLVSRSYMTRIAEGSYYAYRVTTPQRATVGLVRRDGEWCLHQIRGPRNTAAKPATWGRVRAWLARRLHDHSRAGEQGAAQYTAAEGDTR